MTQKRDYSTILFSPERAAQLTTAYLKERRENAGQGVPLGLESLDKPNAKGERLLPLYPGELCSIVARPGCGKTGFMVRWARARADWLRAQKITNRLVLYVTLEQSVEELNAFNYAADQRVSITKMAAGEITDDEWNRCLKSSVTRTFMPLWNIGYSSMTDEKQIRIDLDAIDGALELALEGGRKLDMVFVDYLQRMPSAVTHGEDSKSVGVSNNLDGLKTIALRRKCPLVAGVQAKREVDNYGDKLPELDDGQWTSNIEQSSDRVIALMRPAKYWKIGEVTDRPVLQNLPVTKNMLVIGILKQKLGPDNFFHLAYFDPEYNKLDELELRQVRL